MSALAVVPKPVVTLYDVEDTLAAMTECVETVAPDQEAEFLQQFSQALMTAKDKRDRVAQFMSHLEAQAAFAKAEIDRLRARKDAMENALDKLKGYVVKVIESLGPDAKGKPVKLEGNVTTFSIRKCPTSVEITDEAAVPLKYKAITVEMPAESWEVLLDMMDVEEGAFLQRSITAKYSVDKKALKAALEAGPVAGADFAAAKSSLVRK